jgi:hypothetical protein
MIAYTYGGKSLKPSKTVLASLKNIKKKIPINSSIPENTNPMIEKTKAHLEASRRNFFELSLSRNSKLSNTFVSFLRIGTIQIV